MSMLLEGTVALVVAIALMILLRPVAAAIGYLDVPDGRKVHDGPVPILGGVAMYGALLAAAAVNGAGGRNGLVLLSAAGLMVLIGALDDRFDLHPAVRLLVHTAAAVILVWGTGYVVADLGNLVGLGDVQLGDLRLPFTVVACVAMVNALNMLDGMDGLAGGVSLFAFLGLGLIAAGNGLPATAFISWGLVGALVGFLSFNVPLPINRPYRSFMGDAGSTMLGFLIAAVALLLIQPDKAAVPPVLILWLAAIPIYELFATTARRLWGRRPPWLADRTHFHHRLHDANFSVRAIFALYMCVSALMMAIGLLAWRAGVPDHLLFAGFVASFVLWLAFIRMAPRWSRHLPGKLRRDCYDVGC